MKVICLFLLALLAGCAHVSSGTSTGYRSPEYAPLHFYKLPVSATYNPYEDQFDCATYQMGGYLNTHCR